MEVTRQGRTSDTACFASSPGRMSRTDVWISRLVTVGFLLYRASAYAQQDVVESIAWEAHSGNKRVAYHVGIC